jgi:hypothetical protein
MLEVQKRALQAEVEVKRILVLEMQTVPAVLRQVV